MPAALPLVVMAGSAIAGGVAAAQARRGGNTQTQTQNTTPWQADQLNAGFDHSRALFDDYRHRSPYGGDLSADMNNIQQRGVNNLIARADNNQANVTRALGQADGLIRQADDFTRNAGVLARQGADPANATATNVLARAATGGLNAPSAVTKAGVQNLQGAAGTATNLVRRASGDPAQRALATGNNYANSAVVREQIDNAALDVTRNFNENTAPGLNARASAGGNLNSARAGIAEAVARRDAGESVGRIAATVRGNAFNQGVDASLTGNEQNNALALGANQQRIGAGTAIAGVGENVRQFNVGTRVGAADSLGARDTANRALEVNTRLEANDQLGRGALSGFDALGASMDMADQNANRYLAAGGIIQQEQQRAIDEAQADYYRTYNYHRGLVDDHLSSVGGNYGGSTVLSTTNPSPSILQGALGGAMMGAGAYGAMRRPSVGAGYGGTKRE